MRGKKILLIEDNEKEAEAIADFLEPIGAVIQHTPTGDAGLAAAKADRPDAIILDIRLATEDEGFRVLRALRDDPATRSIPVVVFSVTGGEVDNRIRGLRLGAYYYLLKTKSLAELEATLRRALEISHDHPAELPDPRQMSLYFDHDSGALWLDGQRTNVGLSDLQRKLLAFLFERRGLICSRDDIAARVYETETNNQMIDRLVSRLREKLGDDPTSPRFIETVRGVGYKLLVDEVRA